METKGKLYIVATPIGNMDDITLRALRVLSAVDIIAAEDTRHTGKLLAHHNISGKLVAYHEHNEIQKSRSLIEKVLSGASVAVVTDAGTPLVSDPGYRIVQAAIAEGIQPIPLPGPSAAVTALSVSGLPTDMFSLIGFLPKKKRKRKEILKNLANSPGTLIFYESPKRMHRLLQEIQEALGDREVVFARELTKRYETFQRGTVSQLIQALDRQETIKGECTVLVSGKPQPPEDCTQDIQMEIRKRLRQPDTSTATLSRELADQYHLPRKQIYQTILQYIKDTQGESHANGQN